MDHLNETENYRNTAIKVSGPLAMAYIPWQKFRNLYAPEVGYKKGTIFRELDLPFEGGKRL